MQDRLANQVNQFLEDILAAAFGGADHRRQGGIGARPPVGAETAEDFAMNHRRAQSAFAGVVVGVNNATPGTWKVQVYVWNWYSNTGEGEQYAIAAGNAAYAIYLPIVLRQAAR